MIGVEKWEGEEECRGYWKGKKEGGGRMRGRLRPTTPPPSDLQGMDCSAAATRPSVQGRQKRARREGERGMQMGPPTSQSALTTSQRVRFFPNFRNHFAVVPYVGGNSSSSNSQSRTVVSPPFLFSVFLTPQPSARDSPDWPEGWNQKEGESNSR